MTELLKTEWTKEDVLKQARESCGFGIFIPQDESKKEPMIYIPMSEKEFLAFDGLLDDFESNYFLIYHSGLSRIPIDPNARDKSWEQRESFLAQYYLALYPVTRLEVFNDMVWVPEGEKLTQFKKWLFAFIHDSKWTHPNKRTNNKPEDN
jgi:hypothetical protein